MSGPHFTVITEADWRDEYHYLQRVAEWLATVFDRTLTLEECHCLSGVLHVHNFRLADGTVVNGDDDASTLGNREVAAVVGCLHEEFNDAQWWYMTLLSMPPRADDEKGYQQMLAQISSHPSVLSVS